jgi:hypothetical protein
VLADIHDVSIAGNPGPMMYVPFAQVPFWGGEVVVRSSLSAAEVAAAIRTETHNIDKDLPVTRIESFPEAMHASVAEDAGRIGGCVPSGAASDPHRPDGRVAL